MTKLLEEAIESIRQLSESEQDIAAQFLLTFANHEAAQYQLTNEQVAEVELAKKEVRSGGIASEADMDDLWRRFSR